MCVRKEAGARGGGQGKREAKDRGGEGARGKEEEAAWQRASGACSLLPDDRVHRLLLAAGAPKSRIFVEATRARLAFSSKAAAAAAAAAAATVAARIGNRKRMSDAVENSRETQAEMIPAAIRS